MATKEQLARQFQRETEARTEAITRLRERTAAAEERMYASATVYGSAFINAGLNNITKEISQKIGRITQGWPSDKAAAVAYVKDCDPGILALITAKGTLDILGVKRIDKLTYAAATTHIGSLVYHQIMLDRFAKEYPELFERAALHIHEHKGYGYKVQRYRAMMRKHDVEIMRWSTSIRHLVGGWLLDRLVRATGWVTTKLSATATNSRITYLVYQPEIGRAHV